ncbi:MAG: DUF58 domain-containing protein [Defluviicoccus sp.]|nr:DUF58 domain-containing protein [Defluviicoccus sp.]MDE0383823.1 DUF58 domain-containing protein [Defluviicoccus sp.]
MRTPRIDRFGVSPDRAGPALRRGAEEAAARIPELMVEADRIASSVIAGIHGRRRVGRGDTFWQFRQYQPGDSAQSIDWRQTAKSRFAYVRETEWEAAQSVWIWCDASPSMRFRSDPGWPDKQQRAAVLALAVAILLVRGGERIALLGSGLAPDQGRGALERFTECVVRALAEESSLPRVEPLPRHARLVILGDLLSPLAEIERTIRDFAAMGVAGHLLRVIDPAELSLPYNGRVRFEGLEDEGGVVIGRVGNIREDYAGAMARHREGLGAIVRSLGWTVASHVTDQPPQTALLALHAALAPPEG